MLIRKIKVQPVAWATTLLTVLIAIEAVSEAAHLLPAAWTPYLLGAIAVLTAVLGVKVHGAVTPLARPQDDGGVPLVPKPFVSGGIAAARGPEDIGRSGMHSW